MDVFDLFAKITLDASAYEKGLNSAKNSLSSFGGMMGNAFGTIAKIGTAAFAAAGTAVVGFGATAVKTGAQFDTSMSQVVATMGFTVDELNTAGSTAQQTYQTLSEFAQEMGRTTAFSASEAADALNYMALAGYDVDTSMEMLPNVLNLAAAGAMDLASASDMVTDAATALGLTLDNGKVDIERTTQLVDEMAKTASKTNTSVDQLGSAILTVGGTAKILKGGMVELADGTKAAYDGTTELSAALGLLADNGIKGSEGGTALRNILTTLSGKKFANTFGEMGVAVYDATGQMRSMKDILSDMNGVMTDMTEEEKTKLITQTFNARDLKSVNALLATTGERWDEITTALLDSEGAAEAMANVQLDNLNGDITLFKSALEGAQIAVSEGITPSLREFVQFGTKGLSEMTEAFQQGGLEGAMSKFGELLSEGLTMIIGKVPEIMSAAGQLLVAFGSGLIENAPVLYNAAVEVVNMFLDGLLSATEGLASEDIGDKIINTIMGFNADASVFLDKGIKIVNNILAGITAALPALLEGGALMIDNLLKGLMNNLPSLVSSAANLLSSLAEGITKGGRILIKSFTNVITEGLKGLTNPQALSQILHSAAEMIRSLAEGLIEAIPEVIAALPEIIENIVTFFLDAIPTIINLILDIWDAIMQNLPTIIEAITEALPTIIEAILNGWIQAIPLIVDGFVRLVAMIAEHAPEIFKAFVDSIGKLIEPMLEKFAEIGEAIKAYFAELFVNLGALITDWWTNKKQQIDDAWNIFVGAIALWLEDIINRIRECLSNIINKFLEWAEEALEWVATDVPRIIEAIINWFKELPGKIWTWLKEVVGKLVDWAKEMKDKISEEVPKIINHIAEFFEELPEKAMQWGKDLILSFVEGIKSMAEYAWESVSQFAQGIVDRLGHSHPKTGPMARDYEWMPDMMELFAEGIKDNSYKVYNEVEKSFDFSDMVKAPKMEEGNISWSAGQTENDEYDKQIIGLLREILDKDTSVVLEGDTKEIFRVVDDENRIRTKATGYNPLSMRRV